MIKENLWKQMREFASKVAKGFLAYYFLREYVFEFNILEGPSMEPTLSRNGCIVFVDKISVMLRKVRKNEIISIRSPVNPEILLCKRIRGIEGDIKVKDNKRIQIPSGFIWIEGDNKMNSFDSKIFGPIKGENVVGSILFQIYPKFKWLGVKQATEEHESYNKI